MNPSPRDKEEDSLGSLALIGPVARKKKKSTLNLTWLS